MSLYIREIRLEKWGEDGSKFWKKEPKFKFKLQNFFHQFRTTTFPEIFSPFRKRKGEKRMPAGTGTVLPEQYWVASLFWVSSRCGEEERVGGVGCCRCCLWDCWKIELVHVYAVVRMEWADGYCYCWKFWNGPNFGPF